jgi:hypothetical protein
MENEKKYTSLFFRFTPLLRKMERMIFPDIFNVCDQVKKTEMSRTRGTYGGKERCLQSFGGET